MKFECRAASLATSRNCSLQLKPGVNTTPRSLARDVVSSLVPLMRYGLSLFLLKLSSRGLDFPRPTWLNFYTFLSRCVGLFSSTTARGSRRDQSRVLHVGNARTWHQTVRIDEATVCAFCGAEFIQPLLDRDLNGPPRVVRMTSHMTSCPPLQHCI